MLLCKHPGDRGVFATATPESIRVYFLSASPRMDEVAETVAGAESTGFDTSETQRLHGYQVSTANNTAATFGGVGAPGHIGMTRVAVEGRWGSPLPPSCVIPFSLLHGTEKKCKTSAVGGLGMPLSGFEGRTSGVNDENTPGCVPLSLSISSADDKLQLFVSDSNGGAWVGACDGVEGAFSLLHTISAGTLDTASCSYSGSYCGGSDIGMRHDTAFHNGHGADIVASGWDPRNAAVLAIGRRDGVVQLLDLESGTLPVYTTSTVGPGKADHLAGVCSSPGYFCASSTSHTLHNRTGCVRYGTPTSAPSVVQERVLQGSVTSLDWVPRSHMTALAARRPDGIGCYVEVMDLRTPESGIRYFGAPSGAITLSQHYNSNTSHNHQRHELGMATGSLFSPLCCAELVACDDSQRYVAAVGSHNLRDVVQLWDLRMTSRPVSSHVCHHAGYTSLSWSACDIPTVFGTTRNGELRMHVFADVHRSDGSDEDEERALPETDDDGAPADSLSSMTPFLVRGRVTKPSEGRCRLHTCVPVASALWLSGRHSIARPHDGGLTATEFPGGQAEKKRKGGQRNTSQHVDSGCRTNLPCLLLLSAKTGELYPQVFFPKGSTVTMLGDLPLLAAGPNVCFLMPEEGKSLLAHHYRQQPLTPPPPPQQQQQQQQELKQRQLYAEDKGDRENEDGQLCAGLKMTSPTDSSADSASIHDIFDSNSEADRGDRLLSNSLRGVTACSTWSNVNTIDSSNAAVPTCTGMLGISGIDRTVHCIDRLRSGFYVQLNKVLSVLLQEGVDREAYVLFRYGWYAQRYLYPGKPAVPTANVIPGLLELLQSERLLATSSTSPSLSLPPQQQIREVILRGMGWHIEKQDEQSMVAELVGNVRNAMTPSCASSVSPAGHTLFPAQQPYQQPESGALVSPKLCSGASACESADPISRLTPLLYGGLPASTSALLEPCDCVQVACIQEAVERRAAILVCMGQLADAALLLSRCNNLHPLYSSVALVLSVVAANNSIPAAASSFAVSGCSYWLEFCMALVLEIQAHTPAPTDVEGMDLSNKRDCDKAKTSNKGNWLSRLSLQTRREYFTFFMRRFPRLPLSDRIAFATVLLLQQQQQQHLASVEFLGDSYLSLIEVLQEMARQQFESVGTGGCSLLLAAAVEGLHQNCISLQRYVDQTGDVQTPLVYVALFGAAKSTAWRCWNDAYRSQLNADGHVFLRSRHDLSCAKMTQLRAGDSDVERGKTLPMQLGSFDGLSPPAANLIGGPFGGLTGGAATETKANPSRRGKRSVELNCKCGLPIATVPPTRDDKMTIESHNRDLCSSPSCLTPMCTVCGERMFSRAGGYSFDQCFTWCTVCLHGGHLVHLRDWFAKHRLCPAEDCPCPCYHPSSTQ